MPGMDGLTFLRRAGEVSPMVKVVVVSAYSDMSNIREAMNRGAFDFLVKPIDFKDLEVTIDKTLKHARELRRTMRSTEENSLLRMFVNTGILERILPVIRLAEVTPSEAIEATVAFVDVADFTTLLRTGTPEHALRTLNANFEVILPELTTRGGVVDKFIGDAVMGVFRGEDHLTRALDACVAARAVLQDLAARTGEGSPYAHGVCIGIDSGVMISGSIGSKVVSRLDYTVLGDVVNRAAHLAALAGKGKIYVTDAVYRVARERYECSSVGVHEIARKLPPVAIHEVGGRLEPEPPSSAAETVLMDDGDDPVRA